MSIGGLMFAALLVLVIQLAVRGRTYGTNKPGDVLPATANADLVEIAQQRGWGIVARWTERLGHTQTIVRPLDGSSWQFTLETWSQVLGGAVYGHNPRDNEWLDPSITLTDGVVMIGPPETSEAIAFITGLAGFFDTGKGRFLANGLHKVPPGLRHLPNPAGLDLPFTMLSNLDHTPDLPLDVITRHLREWTADHPRKDDHPVITCQPDGLTVRLIRSTRDPVLLEELIDFANALRRDL